MENLLYEIISILMIVSSLMVISAVNPVHSIFYLVLVFINATILLLMWHVDFIAMMLLIIYVGAIAILFIFSVMMLNIKIVEITENQLRYLPLGGVIAIIFLLELLVLLERDIIKVKGVDQNVSSLNYLNWNEMIFDKSNIRVLGEVLYTEYAYLFLLVSLILLIAMIGAIILTERSVLSEKKQDLGEQINRDYLTSIRVIKS